MVKKPGKLAWILFLCILFAELAAGIYISLYKNYLFGDSLSRIATAFSILYIHPSQLTPVHLIWPPLPSLLELPILLLWPVYKPIASFGLAGIILTSVFAAGSSVLIYKHCSYFRLSRFHAVLITLLYSLNPFVFIYGLSGMSEAIFFFMVIWAISHLCQWLSDQLPFHIIHIGAAMSLAFLARYEAVPLSIALGFSVIISILFMQSRNQNLKQTLSFLEGTSIMLFTPIFFTAVIWILFNLFVSGNPLQFINSYISSLSAAPAGIFEEPMGLIAGNLGSTLLYMLEKSLIFLPPFFSVILLRIFTRRLFKWDFFILFLLILSANIFQMQILLKSTSSGLSHFFAYLLPIVAAWLPYELSKLQNSTRFVRYSAILLSCISLLSSGIWFYWSPVKAGEAYTVTHFMNLIKNNDTQNIISVAGYINHQLSHSILLMDYTTACPILLRLGKVENVVTNSSPNFDKVVLSPKEYGVDYILIPLHDDGALNMEDAICSKYPEINRIGLPGYTLDKEFKNYRLYKASRNTPLHR